MFNTSHVDMALRLQLFDKFFFTHKILVYVKDEGPNLQTCASALNLIVSYGSLVTLEPFDRLCFGHALSNVCQFSTTNKKVTHRLFYTSIMIAQVNIQKSLPGQRNLEGETNFRKNLNRFWLKVLKIEHNCQDKVYHFYSIF